jgi:hypothetical protein
LLKIKLSASGTDCGISEWYIRGEQTHVPQNEGSEILSILPLRVQIYLCLATINLTEVALLEH